MTNKFQVLLIGTNWYLANLILDWFEEEDQVEIVMSNLEEPTVTSPHLEIDTSNISILDIDDLKMKIAEAFVEWSEDDGA